MAAPSPRPSSPPRSPRSSPNADAGSSDTTTPAGITKELRGFDDRPALRPPARGPGSIERGVCRVRGSRPAIVRSVRAGR
jgi:hypothetical protein